MTSSRMERMVFKFSTCIQQKAPMCVYNVGPEAVRTASQDLLVKLSDDSGVVTVVDDGRIDWDRLIAAHNFKGQKINWYPSDFNGLSKAFGGSIARGFEWDAIPFDCKNGRWSFDISNVQRAAPPAKLFGIRRSRESLNPSNISKHACPSLGCTSVYVLSREAWEKVSTPGLDDVKGLHNIQCWARDLCNSRVPHDPGPVDASSHSIGSGSGRLPDIVADGMWNSIPNSHSAPPSNNPEKAPVETPIEAKNALMHVPNRVSSKPEFTNSTDITVKQVDLGAKLPARPSWVPSRRDSLIMEPVTSQKPTTAEPELHGPESTSPAYNSPDYFFKELGLCFPVHFLETVFEEDEDRDVESVAAPTTSKNELIEPPNEPEDNQLSSFETYVTDMIVHHLYGPRAFEKRSPLFVKCRIMMDFGFILLLIFVVRFVLIILAGALIKYRGELFDMQERKAVEYVIFIETRLRDLGVIIIIPWLFVFFEALRDPALWPPYEWLKR